MKYQIFWVLLVPYLLFGWGDADRLEDGSCRYDKETGYVSTHLYTKKQEGYTIVDVADSRYGTTSTIYNAYTCEKITSGNKSKSNFTALMKKRGFSPVRLKRNKLAIDKTFQNSIYYSENDDYATIRLHKVDTATTKELHKLLSLIAQKHTSPKLSISAEATKLARTDGFERAFINKINATSGSQLNIPMALAISKAVGIYDKIAYDLFTKYLHSKVKSVAKLPQWAKEMQRFGASEYIPKLQDEIMKIADFGKHLTIDNFLSSNEYKYALRYSKPKVNKILQRSIYGLHLEYGNKKIELSKTGNCQMTHTSESEFGCGFFWMKTCIGTYNHYKCRANISKLAKIERTLVGNTKVSSTLQGGWQYNYMTSRRVKPSENSGNSGIKKDQCYKIKEYAAQEVCLRGTGSKACYGLKDYGLRDICLHGTGGNSCYSFKDYNMQQVCLKGIRSDACNGIADYQKRRSCKTFSGDTDFWLIISSYGYYTNQY